MEAYRIDRFGSSVDGIVLRSSEDPRPGRKEVLMRVRASSLNYPRFDGPQRRRSWSGKVRCRAAFRRGRRGRCHWRRGHAVKLGERVVGPSTRAGSPAPQGEEVRAFL
jgi:hypothetical protein